MPSKPPLGQHWLADKVILNHIVSLAQLKAGETVLEIGTGLGYLTDVLLQTEASIVSLEYDGRIYQRLLSKYSSQLSSRLHLIHGDIRHFDWRQLPAGYKICANIPYYLSSYLLRLLTDTCHKPSLAVLLLPEAIALKLQHLTKRSLLATICQHYYQITLDDLVKAESFQPPPAIDSRIVILKHQPAFPDLLSQDQQLLIKLYKVAFSSPRKQLGVNLKNIFSISKVETEVIFQQLSFKSSLRAEVLTNSQWQELLGVIKPYIKLKPEISADD